MRKPLLPLFIRAQAELTASVSRVVDIIEAMGLECYPPQYSWYGGRGVGCLDIHCGDGGPPS